jgi:hypothetical protein
VAYVTSVKSPAGWVLLPTCATTHERPAIDLRRTGGYIVADRRGRVQGKVACPMYRTAWDVPDAPR